MKRRRFGLAQAALRGGVLVAAVFGLLLAAPASADGPQVGSTCDKDQVNDTTTSSVDTMIRCIEDDSGRRIWTATSNAADTVNQLKAAGYTVTVDRIGDGPPQDCKVVAIRNPVVSTKPQRDTHTNDAGQRETAVVIRQITVTAECPRPVPRPKDDAR